MKPSQLLQSAKEYALFQFLASLRSTRSPQVRKLLDSRKITTVSGTIPLPDDVTEVSICCHSDTPVSLITVIRRNAHSECLFDCHSPVQGAVEIATAVKELVDAYNKGGE